MKLNNVPDYLYSFSFQNSLCGVSPSSQCFSQSLFPLFCFYIYYFFSLGRFHLLSKPLLLFIPFNLSFIWFEFILLNPIFTYNFSLILSYYIVLYQIISYYTHHHLYHIIPNHLVLHSSSLISCISLTVCAAKSFVPYAVHPVIKYRETVSTS